MFIRTYEARDFGVIAQLHGEAIAQGHWSIAHGSSATLWQPAVSASYTDAIPPIRLVLEHQGQVIGWGWLGNDGSNGSNGSDGSCPALRDPSGYHFAGETSIYLALAERGRGAGGRLQRSLLHRAKALGYHHIVAKLLTENRSGLEFYKRFGFSVVGIQKEIVFFQERWRDVVILQLLI